MAEEKREKFDAKRICIYPKDIQILTGKSECSAPKIMARLKENLSKDKHQVITIKEFCEYMGFNIEEVKPLIK
jgi:hypothetical protein